MAGGDGGPSSWDAVDDDLRGYLSDTPPQGPFEAPEYLPDYSHCIVVDNLPKVCGRVGGGDGRPHSRASRGGGSGH